MLIRICKIVLVAAVAFFLTLVVFNNLTDYNSNYQFVEHVLSMDTTFPGNAGMWRALKSPAIDVISYDFIILWESLTALLCWWGVGRCVRHLSADTATFNRSKNIAVLGLTASLIQWFVGFISVGGEWFLMWQSKIWNGQDAAFRMFTTIGIILIFLLLREREE